VVWSKLRSVPLIEKKVNLEPQRLAIKSAIIHSLRWHSLRAQN
jgi:hypothetical protein